MTNKEQLAYLAGLVDGEGCLHYLHQTYKKSDYYYPRLSITNTNKWVLEWVKLLFGGTIRLDKRKAKPHHKVKYRWCTNCKNAVILVESLLPYLKIKMKEAKIFIQYSNIDIKLRYQISDKLKELKR